MMRSILVVTAIVHLIRLARCQYFPPIPENVQTVQSKFHNGISISYKEVQHNGRYASSCISRVTDILF